MNSFQKYPFTFPYYNNYYRRKNSFRYNNLKTQKDTISFQSQIQNQNKNKEKLDENFWFDIFGIKLYFDDVLILSLLFFLYKEQVKDEGLFLALILLLIS